MQRKSSVTRQAFVRLCLVFFILNWVLLLYRRSKSSRLYRTVIKQFIRIISFFSFIVFTSKIIISISFPISSPTATVVNLAYQYHKRHIQNAYGPIFFRTRFYGTACFCSCHKCFLNAIYQVRPINVLAPNSLKCLSGHVDVTREGKRHKL